MSDWADTKRLIEELVEDKRIERIEAQKAIRREQLKIKYEKRVKNQHYISWTIIKMAYISSLVDSIYSVYQYQKLNMTEQQQTLILCVLACAINVPWFKTLVTLILTRYADRRSLLFQLGTAAKINMNSWCFLILMLTSTLPRGVAHYCLTSLALLLDLFVNRKDYKLACENGLRLIGILIVEHVTTLEISKRFSADTGGMLIYAPVVVSVMSTLADMELPWISKWETLIDALPSNSSSSKPPEQSQSAPDVANTILGAGLASHFLTTFWPKRQELPYGTSVRKDCGVDGHGHNTEHNTKSAEPKYDPKRVVRSSSTQTESAIKTDTLLPKNPTTEDQSLIQEGFVGGFSATNLAPQNSIAALTVDGVRLCVVYRQGNYLVAPLHAYLNYKIEPEVGQISKIEYGKDVKDCKIVRIIEYDPINSRKTRDGVVLLMIPNEWAQTMKALKASKAPQSSKNGYLWTTRNGEPACIAVSITWRPEYSTHNANTIAGDSGAPVTDEVGKVLMFHAGQFEGSTLNYALPPPMQTDVPSQAESATIIAQSKEIENLKMMMQQMMLRQYGDQTESKGKNKGSGRTARNYFIPKPKRLQRIWTQEKYEQLIAEGWTRDELKELASSRRAELDELEREIDEDDRSSGGHGELDDWGLEQEAVAMVRYDQGDDEQTNTRIKTVIHDNPSSRSNLALQRAVKKLMTLVENIPDGDDDEVIVHADTPLLGQTIRKKIDTENVPFLEQSVSAVNNALEQWADQPVGLHQESKGPFGCAVNQYKLPLDQCCPAPCQAYDFGRGICDAPDCNKKHFNTTQIDCRQTNNGKKCRKSGCSYRHPTSHGTISPPSQN